MEGCRRKLFSATNSLTNEEQPRQLSEAAEPTAVGTVVQETLTCTLSPLTLYYILYIYIKT